MAGETGSLSVLDSPAFYAPWMKGVYEVSPNLRLFGTDFGNGVQDAKLFQFDSELAGYRQSKLASIAENKEKYVARQDLRPEVEAHVLDLMVSRLLLESPPWVKRTQEGLEIEGERVPISLDELILNVQEDVAVVTKDGNCDWIAYVNVCNPSHWLPTEKIGLSFFDAHLPVPGFERINRAAGAMVDSMISRGPFVRFVWGLESDDQLNHHPVAPDGRDQKEWYGRQFERGVFVRVERQVLWPLPEVSSALFTIRPYVYGLERVKGAEGAWESLVRAYRSMSDEARAYKGLPANLI